MPPSLHEVIAGNRSSFIFPSNLTSATSSSAWGAAPSINIATFSHSSCSSPSPLVLLSTFQLYLGVFPPFFKLVSNGKKGNVSFPK